MCGLVVMLRSTLSSALEPPLDFGGSRVAVGRPGRLCPLLRAARALRFRGTKEAMAGFWAGDRDAGAARVRALEPVGRVG